ncbi:MAG: hypothetical protein ACREU3_18570, partial [Steroidobacteraceae bacterium]
MSRPSPAAAGSSLVPDKGRTAAVRALPLALAAALSVSSMARAHAPAAHAPAARLLDIGLARSGAVIEADSVAGRPGADRTVLLLGGLSGKGPSVAAAHAALEAFRRVPQRERAFRLVVIALANPDAAPLQFPPTGTAYHDHPASFALWRWIGVHAPDLVLVAGSDPAGLAAALSTHAVAEVGRVPARDGWRPGDLERLRSERLEISPAHREIERREARSPLELARELAVHYGHEFNYPIYIDAIALMAQLRLGHLREVERLVEPYVDGSRNSLEHPNSLVFAGHLIFGALAKRTGEARYRERVIAAAAYGFEPDGRMKEAMPFNDGFSDSLFMG